MEHDLCFTVWVGQQEKEIRNIKPKTTISDVISALLREHLRSIFVADDRFVASLPYLCHNLKDSFVIRLVSYDGTSIQLDNNKSILKLIQNENQPTNYVLKMLETQMDDFVGGNVYEQLDEIEVIRGILLQDQRISEQKIILQNLDSEIQLMSSNQELVSSEEVELQEFISISSKLLDLQEKISFVEAEAIDLFDEIEQNKNLDQNHKSVQNRPIIAPPQMPPTISRSATLPRKPKPTPDFYHGRSDSDSSYDSGYQPIKSNSVHYSATLPRRPKSDIKQVNGQLTNQVVDQPRASVHVPAVRRDIEPEMENNFLSKWPSMNIIRRSVSEMHLTKEPSIRNITDKIDKIDTDSDTGISSLHSSDNESFPSAQFIENNLIKCETLV